jgi:hypothetical protein
VTAQKIGFEGAGQESVLKHLQTRPCLQNLSMKLRAIIIESLSDIAPVAVDENSTDVAADNPRYELNGNRAEDIDHERGIHVASGGKRKHGQCTQSARSNDKKFAIHERIAMLLYALTITKCCARIVQNKKSMEI